MNHSSNLLSRREVFHRMNAQIFTKLSFTTAMHQNFQLFVSDAFPINCGKYF